MKKSNKIKQYDCLCGHIAVFVKDIEKSSKFYITKLGFKSKREYVINKKTINKLFGINSSGLIRYLEREGFGVELIRIFKLNTRKKNTSGSHHWAMLVKDKDRFCKDLRKKKIKVTALKRTHDFVYFIEDPEKNLIEVKNKTL